MSQKELKKKIQEQFSLCEQQLIKAIEHTKKRIVESLDLFQKEKLNAINKSFLTYIQQLKHSDHDTKLEHHILSSINQMNDKFPEFQKILKAQIRIPLREVMRKIEFDLPKMETLPLSFNLSHKKSLNQTSAQLAENQAINCVTSLSQNQIAAVVNTKIKVLDVNQEKIIASVVAHSEKITSLNFFNIKRLINPEDSITLAQKMKQNHKKSNRKHSMHHNKIAKLQNATNRPHSYSAESMEESIHSSNNNNSINDNQISMNDNNIILNEQTERKFVNENIIVSTSLDKRCQFMNSGDFSLINTIKLNKQGHNAIKISEREILIQQTDGFSIFKDLKKKTGEFKFSQQILRCAYSSYYNTIIIHLKNRICCINKRTMKLVNTFAGPAESLYMKIIGREIFIIHTLGIIVQDIQTGKIKRQKILSLSSPICSLTDLLDESHVAVITLKNEVAILDYINFKIISTLNLGGKSGARSITYMNDGQNFAINTIDNKIKLWTFSKY